MGRILLSVIACMLIISCTPDTLDKLSMIGKEPMMSESINGERQIEYTTISDDEHAFRIQQSSNSLWNENSKMLFQNVRANKLGDIVTVKISINDQAKLDNKMEKDRGHLEQVNAPILGKIPSNLLGTRSEPVNIINMQGNTSNFGEGKIERKDRVDMHVAATVTKVLPSGNLVIQGTQEIKVNYEIRTIMIKGVIRSEDIDLDNSIEYTKIADLRVDYGGRGQLYSVQQPRVGVQVIDAISPF
ncbi:MAG: flagellar L-ring protein [Candidatus Xenolissoclinum pacificiensis L6]|uniref:Flagellar L-ring protein n=1 Tax=Candidatus Xenolissoclinum pacificiensis L6 TaxID=1401685 RepID=W2UZA4_9RICK|nr:MAG: flagellar L-ring protein [Candidatus Xenolissoclinum pacificiensis L6]